MTFPPFYSIPGKGVERATPQVNMNQQEKGKGDVHHAGLEAWCVRELS